MSVVMRLLTSILFVFGMLFLSPSWAKTEQEVRVETIQNLEKDGFITPSAKKEALARYTVAASAASSPDVAASMLTKQQIEVTNQSWYDRFVTWPNVIKTIGLLFVLIAFWKFIAMIGFFLLHSILANIPVWVFQLLIGSFTLTCTLFANQLVAWTGQSQWVAIFGTFSNLAVIGWIAKTYPNFTQKVLSLFKLGIPAAVVTGFWSMVYFGSLAMYYNSEILGFFAVVSLCAMLSFSISFFPGVTVFSVEEKGVTISAVAHLLLLVGMAYMNYTATPVAYYKLWSAGLNYYVPIALGVSLLIGASPFGTNSKTSSTVLMIVTATFCTFAYSMAGMATASTIVGILIAVNVLEWVLYASFQGGMVFGLAVSGASLFTVGMWLESHAALIWAILSK